MRLRVTDEQAYYLQMQEKYPDKYFRLNGVYKFDTYVIDVRRFVDAVTQAMRKTTAVLIFTKDENGKYWQESMSIDEVECKYFQCAESEYIDILRRLLIPQPALGKGSNGRLYVLDTGRIAYFFYDGQHCALDGVSLPLLFHNINAAYCGKPEEMLPDYYEEVFNNRLQENEKREGWDEARAYYEPLLMRKQWDGFPQFDFDNDEHGREGILSHNLDIERRRMKRCYKTLGIQPTPFFTLIQAMMVAQYNGSKDVKVNTVLQGRRNSKERTTFGMFTREAPFVFSFPNDMTPEEICGNRSVMEELCRTTQNQHEMNMKYQYYPVEYELYGGENSVFIYNSITVKDLVIDGYQFTLLHDADKYKTAYEPIEIYMEDHYDCYRLRMEYDTSKYKKETIEKLCEIYCHLLDIVLKMIETYKQ